MEHISVVNLSIDYQLTDLFLVPNSTTMKARLIIALLLAIVIFESCARSFTPYEAANSPRGRKCGVIR